MGLSCVLGWRKPDLKIKDVEFKVFPDQSSSCSALSPAVCQERLFEIRWMAALRFVQHWVTGELVFEGSLFSSF